MSTPFPLEEASQAGKVEPTFDLADNPPRSSFWGDVIRSPYTILEGLGSGAAKGEAVLGGLLHEGSTGVDPENKLGPAGLITPAAQERSKRMAEALNVSSDAVQADARERVKAMTPDATTTGTATQILHGLSSGLEQIITGSLLGGPVGGAASVGAGEGVNRYQELKEQGVDPTTALESGALAGATSGAGALLPAAYGTSLLTRMLTGIAGNTAFGIANRYADHAILEHGGYPEMAEQQRALDTTQILVDAALGATFGVLHHVGAANEEARDPALTANLALKDRKSSPGVPVDPGSAGAHQAALEKAVEDLLQGKRVDVADTGVERAQFMERPTPETATPLNMMANALKESGFLDEEANLRDLEAQFTSRRESTEPTVPRETPQAEKSTVLDDEERSAPKDPTAQALEDRPNMKIPDENGKRVAAADALENAKDDTDHPAAFKAAIDCFARRGA